MKKKVSILKNLSLVLSVVCMSCAGGNVSQNGLFQNDHKELKESLVGSWELTNAGQELYEFYKEGKEVKLKVKGMEAVMERFDSTDGLTFSFQYKNDTANTVFVLGQFKSYQRQELIAVEEVPEVNQTGGILNLTKRKKTVVVEVEQQDAAGEL